MTNDTNNSHNNMKSKAVEDLADRLVSKYETDEFRLWYISSIYKLGLDAILDAEKKADKGKFPGKLFSFLIKEMLDDLNDGKAK